MDTNTRLYARFQIVRITMPVWANGKVARFKPESSVGSTPTTGTTQCPCGEMVDALSSEGSLARGVGSSPTTGTNMDG